MNDKGVGEKLVEAGISSMKAGADEIKVGVSTAMGQITGQQVKSDQELQQISSQDKVSSGKRINEIQQEIDAQKMRRFKQVTQEHAPVASQNQENVQEQQGPQRSTPQLSQKLRGNETPLSVRQAVGNKEQGRNFKG